jgi:hypothetical protein
MHKVQVIARIAATIRVVGHTSNFISFLLAALHHPPTAIAKTFIA